MRRRLVIIFACTFAGALLLVAALPFWLSPVLRMAGRRFGTEFARYERIGYGRFALYDVDVKRNTTHVHVDRVETATPLLWVFHRWSGHPDSAVTTRWRVDVSKREQPRPPSPNAGARELRVQLFKIAGGLDRWLPEAEIGEGVVTWPGAELKLGPGTWKERTLTVRPLQYKSAAGDVRATFARNGELLVQVKGIGQPVWQADLKSVSDDITGDIGVFEQKAALAAHLPERGWMPDTLRLAGEHWSVPASQVKLGESYAAVRGNFLLEWRDGKFEATTDVSGEAAAGKKAPPLHAKLHARGDRESLTVDSLLAEIPGITARLSAPVVFDRSGRASASASTFDWEIDLEKQPWIKDAKGRVAGHADVSPRGAAVPRIEGNFSAQDLALRGWSISRFAGKAALDWPRLTLNEVNLGFAEGGRFTAKGGWDFRTRELIDATGEGELHASLVSPWLPKDVSFESITLNVKANGPMAALQHEGRAHVAALKSSTLHPLAVDVTWHGSGPAVEISEARIAAGDATVELMASLDAKQARVTALNYSAKETGRLSLTGPAIVTWSPQLSVSGLRLASADASVAVALTAGETGHVEVAAKNFPSSWIADFTDLPGPEWQIASLDAQGNWDRGPMTFSVRGGVAVKLAPDRSANVTVAAAGDRDGIRVESLRVAEGTTPIVDATGRIPLTVHPGTGKTIQLEKNAPLAVRATTASNPIFWQKITDATGLEFQEPHVNLELSGTWMEPKGELTAKAARVAVDPKRIKFSFPTVESLDVHATADGKGVNVDRLEVRVEQQQVRARGELPFTFEQWGEFKQSPIAFIRKGGSLRLEIPDADIAAFSRYTGKFLAPAGRLRVAVALKPGGDMEGELRLFDATTRPLGPLGVLQEVQADARLNGRTLELRNVGARAGGQPVTLAGKVELPLNGEPKFDVALKGENLPLVRETGLLLRADLDLKLASQNNTTAVTGAVRLRDSMFLSDVRALIPRGGGGGPARRPPFFSIDVPPLDRWQLGVDVRGDHFMRMRSTVFVGVASAHFRLGGTLGEPRATGEARVDSGQVLLPFATFRVEQGTVRLTESDPYALRLNLVGNSRRYGYDLRMDLTGTATDPVVTFSSSPPLDAKQVLLMVTAGELPRDEITYGGAQRVARLGTYLGQSLINNFGGDAADADRLSISTGERVSRQGRETYDIEYRLNDRFTAVGEYDEFDEYNAGLKWRVFSPKKSETTHTAENGTAKTKEPGDAPAR